MKIVKLKINCPQGRSDDSVNYIGTCNFGVLLHKNCTEKKNRFRAEQNDSSHIMFTTTGQCMSLNVIRNNLSDTF